MIALATHTARRQELARRLGKPVLLMGNGTRLRNLPMNSLPHRQDSSFLYYTGCDLPNAACVIDEQAHTTLYLPLPAPDDALWHGHVDSPEDLRQRYGVDAVSDISQLESDCAGRALLGLAVPDRQATARAAAITGLELSYGKQNGSDELVDSIIAMRRTKTEEELAEHREAAAHTALAFRAAMSGTQVDGHEAHVAALFDAVLAARGATVGYKSIVTVQGEVLHNPTHLNPLQDGQLLLLDGGGELPSGYGVDITRTWPVNGRFSPRQRDAYQAVLAANHASIAMCRPGVRYRDVHMRSGQVLAQWLLDEGLLLGSLDQAMETHAHALFFPHGVGHLLGMDVHDLEQFGDRAAYAPGRSRSDKFGTAYLRMDLDLEPGFLLTIEPGFYVVPAILHDEQLRQRFEGQVDWHKAEQWLGFGGIRIEDDVLVTTGEPEVLTAATPKTITELEALVGSGPSALERLS